jgi:hypothetical protein
MVATLVGFSVILPRVIQFAYGTPFAQYRTVEIQEMFKTDRNHYSPRSAIGDESGTHH